MAAAALIVALLASLALLPRTVSAATIDTSAYYTLVARHSGKVLDVAGASTADGANVQQWTNYNASNQQWQFVASGGGYYRLKARHTGKVLDVNGGSTADGANVQQWTDYNANNQQWSVVDTNSGYVKLINRNSGKVLDVNGGSTADGANVQQWSDYTANNQQWQLVKAGGSPTPVPTPAPTGSGPPMGFNHYNRFGTWITESTVRQIADAMANNGMRAAGYVYVNLDDGWQGSRDAQGNIQANSNFPSGIKALADYIHGKGLKFGIYTTPTATTCGGKIGSAGRVQQDVNTYASWGVDYIKLDWCGADYSANGAASIARSWRDAIARTGRPMVLSINAGASTSVAPWASTIVNLWRTGDDICASWYNKTHAKNPNARDCYNTQYHSGIYDYLTSNVEPNAPYVGSGHWGDPDMLEVGNPGLSFEEAKTHFSVWAMWAAPLLAGNDPRELNGSDDASKILLNTEVIAIDQDARNAMATKVRNAGGIQIWRKPLAESGAQAVALVNLNDYATAVTLSYSEIGLTRVSKIRDLWLHADVTPGSSSYSVNLPAHGTVLLKITGQ